MSVIPLQEMEVDRLKTRVYDSRESLGEAACADVSAAVKALLAEKPVVRMVFAAAPSQNEFLERLVQERGIDWSRIHVFHMDEYIGLPSGAPESFGYFLRTRLFDRVRPGAVHYLNPGGGAEEECSRYGALLTEKPIDIVCLGIGENGHIAFNDPPVADFRDPVAVKIVELDEACRTQQVNDGCFPSFEAVPTHALTMTIPALTSGERLFCMVPGSRKRQAVRETLNGPISTECPSTILRNHACCILYTDKDSFGN